MPGGSYVGVGVPPEKCASPAHGEGPTKWEGLFRRNTAASCPVHEGLVGLIEELNGAGYRQEILSATRQEELTQQVASRGIADLFERISGTGTILAHGKSGLARDWTEKYRNEEETLWFVGDSPHDAEVARLMGAKCLLVSWGHVSRERLLSLGDPVFETPEALKEYWGI